MSIHCLVIGLIETIVNNLHPSEKQAEEFEKAVTRRLEQVNVEAERDICWTSGSQCIATDSNLLGHDSVSLDKRFLMCQRTVLLPS